MGSYYSTPSGTAKRVYGWKPDLPDVRDKVLTFQKHKYPIKNKVDLRENFSSIYDQGSLGSCTANAICAAFTYDQNKQNLPLFEPSRLFLYYNERDLEGTVDYDSGASIRDGIKSLNKLGICDEKMWPYVIDYFRTKPYDKCFKEARFHKCVRYRKLQNDINQLKMCLSSGKPFVFGFAVYSSFEDPLAWNPKIDEMPIPNPNKEKLLGGHAVVAVGYSDKRKVFIVRNSWGYDWGMEGYFFMPYKFITSEQCSDFWVIDTVSDDEVIIDDDTEQPKPKYNKKKNKKNNRRREDLSDTNEVKTIRMEIPDTQSISGFKKCLIRENDD